MAEQGRQAFGRVLRERRLAGGVSLRKFAGQLGVSPTYLSQVEQGNADPPTAGRVRRIAELLGADPDELTALAGRVPEDLPDLLRRRPAQMLALLRAASGLTAEQLALLVAQAKRLQVKGA